MKDLKRLHVTDFYAYFVNPYNVSRTFLLVIWDIVLEKSQYRRARKNNVVPILDKHHRGRKYPLLRVFTTIIMRELNIYTLIGDMFAGIPSAYATFVGYDEIAHHSGVESLDAFDALRKLDEQFARLESVAHDAPRPYHLVVLSDHGQSGGSTFLQRYGLTLEDLVNQNVTNLVNGARSVVLDLARVPYIDSTRLGELIAVHVTVSRAGGRLALAGATDRITELLTVAGLEGIFESFGSVDQAHTALGA
jgi:anti-anti-sigma factor